MRTKLAASDAGRVARAAIVEDSADVLESLASALAMQGVIVVSRAESSADAIAWLRQHPAGCEVVIVDLFLRSGSGLDVLKELQSMNPRPLAVVLSNYATDHLRRQCEVLGAVRVFDKASEIEHMMSWLGELAASRP